MRTGPVPTLDLCSTSTVGRRPVRHTCRSPSCHRAWPPGRAAPAGAGLLV